MCSRLLSTPTSVKPRLDLGGQTCRPAALPGRRGRTTADDLEINAAMNPLRGINLPYFFDEYGHDLAPNAVLRMGPREIDPVRIYRPLLAARERGCQAVRLWLCESAEGILMNAGTISGAHPVLLESVAIIQECATMLA